MAKVKNPLHSKIASGDFAASIQFVCGHFVREKTKPGNAETMPQGEQRSKFFQGANKWSHEFDKETKEKWKLFKSAMLLSKDCIRGVFFMNGYNLWMLYWLKFGENGWTHYPNPPI